MFDVGFPELLLVSLVMLLVFGPERLPEVLRTVGRFVGGARRSFANLRDELEREVGADEIRRDLHNSRIMEDAKRIGDGLRAGREEVEELLGRRYAELEETGQVPSRAEADASEPASGPEPNAEPKPATSPGAPAEPAPTASSPEAGPAATPTAATGDAQRSPAAGPGPEQTPERTP